MLAYWNRFAFLRFSLVLILGIILAQSLPYLINMMVFLAISSLCSWLFLYLISRQRQVKLHPLSLGIPALIFIASIAYINTYYHSEKYENNHLVHYDIKEISAFKLILDSKEKVTERSYGFQVKIGSVKISERWYNYYSKAILYLQPSELTNKLKYGDELLVYSGLNQIKEPMNPEEFDYKGYLANDQIYFQQYIRADKISILNRDKGNILMAWAIKASQYLNDILKEHIDDPRSLAIAQALTLGVKDDLDDQLRSAYSSAGAMHVLAVSGLHVGIIFMIVAAIFRRWRKRKWGSIAYAIVSLLVLWGFAFITALSPSVLRAATMFSFVVIAQASNRRTNIYNTLAASAFLLLLFDPYLLFTLGFQLSYLAVFGIVYFQPKIQMWLPIKNKWLDKLWALTSVAIAAQLVTAPLGMFYFHQFPTYFFLSNIIVIPAAFFILNACLLLLLSSFWPFMAALIGDLINYFIQWVNKAVFFLQDLPMSTIEGIYFNSAEILLMFLILILFAAFIELRKFHFWALSITSIAIISISVVIRQYQRADQQLATIYHTKKTPFFSLVSGTNAKLIYKNGLESANSELSYNVIPHVKALGVKNVELDTTANNYTVASFEHDNYQLFEWNEHLFLQVNSLPKSNYQKGDAIKIDYLIWSHHVWQDSSVIFEMFKPKLVVLGAVLNKYQLQKAKDYLERQNISYYSVPDSGALEIKI